MQVWYRLCNNNEWFAPWNSYPIYQDNIDILPDPKDNTWKNEMIILSARWVHRSLLLFVDNHDEIENEIKKFLNSRIKLRKSLITI